MRRLTTRQYARLAQQWVASIGLDLVKFGRHSLRSMKTALFHRRAGNPRAIRLLLGYSKVHYVGIGVNDV